MKLRFTLGMVCTAVAVLASAQETLVIPEKASGTGQDPKSWPPAFEQSLAALSDLNDYRVTLSAQTMMPGATFLPKPTVTTLTAATDSLYRVDLPNQSIVIYNKNHDAVVTYKTERVSRVKTEILPTRLSVNKRPTGAVVDALLDQSPRDAVQRLKATISADDSSSNVVLVRYGLTQRPTRITMDATTHLPSKVEEPLNGDSTIETTLKFERDLKLSEDEFVPRVSSTAVEVPLTEILGGNQPATKAPPTAASNTKDAKTPTNDQMAPDFRLSDADGKTVTLSEFRGKNIVVLEFFATWCGPCRSSLPETAKVAREYASKDVTFFAVNMAERPRDVAILFAELMLQWVPVLYDQGQVASAYGVTTLPKVFIINRDGTKFTVIDGANDAGKHLREALDAALSKQAKR